MAVKFYKCAHCGNVVEKLVDSGVPLVCCGQKMEELVPNLLPSLLVAKSIFLKLHALTTAR